MTKCLLFPKFVEQLGFQSS